MEGDGLMDLTAARSLARELGSAMRSLTPSEADELLGLVEAVRTNSAIGVGVSVDQPSLTVGVRFPPCPPDGEKTEGTSEEGEDPEIDGAGRPPSLLVRSLTLEDRLYVALARRGEERIGQFIQNALTLVRPEDGETYDVYLREDASLVSACEDYADTLSSEAA